MSIVSEIIDYLEPLNLLGEIDVASLRRWFVSEKEDAAFDPGDGRPVVSVSQARALVSTLAAHESLLLVSPPGVGKSDIVLAAARQAGLRCHSLLGTQLAPEDLTGVPRIEGGRTVFYPPRIVLPEDNRPFCLFLDELPAAAPDVQKAMYSLLLERRLGEHRLPAGSWVVAAGNRVEDGALVRTLSSALVNRLFVVHLHPTSADWLAWADASNVRTDIRYFIRSQPDALLRTPTDDGTPFSTPRAWASLGSALDRVSTKAGIDPAIRRVLAHGRVSPQDADRYCAFAENAIDLHSGAQYLRGNVRLPPAGPPRWFALAAVREAVAKLDVHPASGRARQLLESVDSEERALLLSGLVPQWGAAAGPTVLRDVLEHYAAEVPERADEGLS